MATAPELQFERELRLAVVMYGGVSLAIYMNGVTQELLQLVRATARNPLDPQRALFTDDELQGTSALVYRQLARLSPGNGPPQMVVPEDPATALRQRVVVDILSGTSAGGINAVFLAKALANGQNLSGLARLWQSQADLGQLINDAESRSGVPKLPSNRLPKSLLNSQRMYRELANAFDAMENSCCGRRSRPSGPLVDELDLFVTATDLEGVPVRLQLGGGEIAEERQYRKSFALSFRHGTNDFEAADNPFLAFIARCTASFPVAFEPMQFSSAAALLKHFRHPLDQDGIPARWRKHFDEYAEASTERAPCESRAFADGGYLDNKPFTYAIEAIGRRRGGDSGCVERKLVYIEPDPERLSVRTPQRKNEPPDLIANAMSVIELRSYETIREELQRLRDRNRLVDKIRSVIAGVDTDFEALSNQAQKELAFIIANRDKFTERSLDQVVKVFGSAYGGFHRLKVGQLTDELSQAVASHAGISPASDEFLAIRMLVRDWRNTRYSPNPTVHDSPAHGPESEFKFLTSFDLSYRLRRASFVIDQLNFLRALKPSELAQSLERRPAICGGSEARAIVAERRDDVGPAIDRIRMGLAEVVHKLRDAREALISPRAEKRVAQIAEHATDVSRVAHDIMKLPTDRQRWELVAELVRAQGNAVQDVLHGMQHGLQEIVHAASREARSACERLLETDSKPQLVHPVLSTPEDVIRYIARHYYTWYELYDSMIFPIIHGTEIGEEIAQVEPIRISPLTGRDVNGLPVAPANLQPSGIAFGHFGAFLHEQWRARDILIGRLNAADKLVTMLLTGTPHDKPELIRTSVRRAHSLILEEECGHTGSSIGEALARVHNANSPETRLTHVEEHGLPAEELPAERTAGWIARATTVLGRVVRETSDRRAMRAGGAILLYAGYTLTGIVEIVVPRRWWANVLRLWIPRLLLFSISLVLLGSLLGREQVSGLGWSILAAIAVLGAITIALRAWIHASWYGVRLWTSLFGLLVLALLVIGVVYAPVAWLDFRARIWEWLH